MTENVNFFLLYICFPPPKLQAWNSSSNQHISPNNLTYNHWSFHLLQNVLIHCLSKVTKTVLLQSSNICMSFSCNYPSSKLCTLKHLLPCALRKPWALFIDVQKHNFAPGAKNKGALTFTIANPPTIQLLSPCDILKLYLQQVWKPSKKTFAKTCLSGLTDNSYGQSIQM